MKLDPAWYQWRTALTLVQATGRSVRSSSDYAITYILDADFARFIAKNRKCLPRWWLDAIELRKNDSSLGERQRYRSGRIGSWVELDSTCRDAGMQPFFNSLPRMVPVLSSRREKSAVFDPDSALGRINSQAQFCVIHSYVMKVPYTANAALSPLP
jgi:Helicase C-terminal domain